jgi:hypothetical protein
MDNGFFLRQELGVLAHMVMISAGPDSIDSDIPKICDIIHGIMMTLDPRVMAKEAVQLVESNQLMRDIYIRHNWADDFRERAEVISRLAFKIRG